ncbi:MAG: hypothetical protein HYZ72_06495 [Deltaproteobacteria bacterium]|nr:hypothetical protein [Deltaproteobacteria bacterium]
MSKSGKERRSGFYDRVQRTVDSIDDWVGRRRRWQLISLDIFFATLITLWAFGDRIGFSLAHHFSVLSSPDPLRDGGKPETFFKYGSIGTEATAGIPYEIWKVLPKVCSQFGARNETKDLTNEEKWYASFGIVKERDRELPIGFSKRKVSIKVSIWGVPILWGREVTRVGINCALCHTATYRTDSTAEKSDWVLGGPAHQFDAKGSLDLLIECAKDLTAKKVIDALKEQNDPPSFWERFGYRLLVPITRRGILERRDDFAFAEKQQSLWRHGRFDAMNGSKIRLLKMPFDGTVGVADIPSIWRLNPAHARNWDGNHTSLSEAIRAEALATGTRKEDLGKIGNEIQLAQCEKVNASETVTGVTVGKKPNEKTEEKSIDENLQWMRTFLQCLSPPAFRRPAFENMSDVDRRQQAENRGKDIFSQHCAECHNPAQDGGPTRLGTVIPLDEVGTDPYRLRSWTPEAVKKKNSLGKGDDWRLSQSRKTNGYVAVPLDGIWLRAPYLHNGSVPTLRALLEPKKGRPVVFYRGSDVIDTKKGGFVAPTPEELGGKVSETTPSCDGEVRFVSPAPEEHGRKLFEFDTRCPGNGNDGHLFGIHLPNDKKEALLEYLKTL